MIFPVALLVISGLIKVAVSDVKCAACVANKKDQWCYSASNKRKRFCVRTAKPELCSDVLAHQNLTSTCSGLYDEEKQPFALNGRLASCVDCISTRKNAWCVKTIDDATLRYCVEGNRIRQLCTNAPISGTTQKSCDDKNYDNDNAVTYIPISPSALPNTCDACLAASTTATPNLWCIVSRFKAQVCVRAATFQFHCLRGTPITNCNKIEANKKTELLPRPPFYMNVQTCSDCTTIWKGKWCVTTLNTQPHNYCMPLTSDKSVCLGGTISTDCTNVESTNTNYVFPDYPNNCTACNTDMTQRWFVSSFLNLKTLMCLPQALARAIGTYGVPSYHCNIAAADQNFSQGLFGKNINPTST